MPRQLRRAADEAAAVADPIDLAMTGGVRYARIPDDRAQEWKDRLHQLLDEFDREPRQGEQAYALVVGLYPTSRPRLSTEPEAQGAPT